MQAWQLLRCQHLYFSTSKASRLRTCEVRSGGSTTAGCSRHVPSPAEKIFLAGEQGMDARSLSKAWQLLRCQYLSFCTSKTKEDKKVFSSQAVFLIKQD
jgi:hypothetical protein